MRGNAAKCGENLAMLLLGRFGGREDEFAKRGERLANSSGVDVGRGVVGAGWVMGLGGQLPIGRLAFPGGLWGRGCQKRECQWVHILGTLGYIFANEGKN